MKKSIAQLLFSVVCLYSGYINAVCVQNPNFNNVISDVPNREYNISYDDLTSRVLDTIQTNEYISYANRMTYNSNYNNDCGTPVLKFQLSSGWTFNNNNTKISGITINKVISNSSVLPMTQNSIPGIVNGFSFIGDRRWTITISKTGQVTQSGYIKSGYLAEMTQTNTKPSASIWNLGKLRIQESSIKINVINCSLKNNQSTYNIDMGDWYDIQFTNINDTKGTVAIPIALSCLAGTNIKVTVTSDSIDNATDGRLKLVGANSATGIAVQLLNNAGTPIVLNQKFTQQNGVPQGDYIFGWKARYIKTAATVTPGTANANATVSILYE